MTDLAETIARVKADHADTVAVGAGSFRITTRAAKALLDAAEAGMRAAQPATREAVQRVKDMGDERAARARDAALEEAARVAEAIDPEKPANWLHARHKIAFVIRSLKGAA